MEKIVRGEGLSGEIFAVPVISVPHVVRRIYLKTKMPASPSNPILIRDLQGFADFAQVESLEQEIWGMSARDCLPSAFSLAAKEAGHIWVGAFHGDKLAGFAYGFFAVEQGQLTVHSHMLGVHPAHQNSDLGYKLKLAQRNRATSVRVGGPRNEDLKIKLMSWTFDPLQSRNAHLNFAKLGVVSEHYKVDFYGPETSSVLHRNGTDRLWVSWPMVSRRVEARVRGQQNRAEMLDALSTLAALVRFNGDGKPVTTCLEAALARQRIAIEIPSDILAVEKKDPALAGEWRLATRWAFSEALRAGFFVAEFCRMVRGQQGPGVYLLERGKVEEFVPEMGPR
jgi:predicted GNAT superfamily acetyltransferase